MYLGYQNGKIKFYTQQPLNKEFYNLDMVEETQDEYVLNGEEYVLKDDSFIEKQALIEKQRIAMLSLTKREVFLALYKAKKITPEMVRANITSESDLIEFDYATEYFRGNPLVDKIGILLGYSSEDLDYLFVNKELPENE